MPDPTESIQTSDGVEIPLGKPLELNDLQSQLIHNEYFYFS